MKSTVLILIAILAAACTASAQTPKLFKAGAAASNITPPLDEPIVGGWNSPPAAHVHDELYARCLVLDDGAARLAIVLVDSLGVSREILDAAKLRIEEKTAIPADRILIAATHTHSSIPARGSGAPSTPTVPGEPQPGIGSYGAFLISRISDGVRRAINNLEPARIGFGRAEEPSQVFNRRYLMKPGTPTPNPFGGVDKAVMNPGQGNPNILEAAGPTDPEIVFISVQSRDSRPIALLANYSLHYVGPAAGPVISADYFGAFADRIQHLLHADRLHPPFVGILSNGTSADINNIPWLEKPAQRYKPYEKMNQVADAVAQAVRKAHDNITFQDWLPLDARRTELALATRKPTPEQLAWARQILDKPDDAPRYHTHERTYANRVLALNNAPDTTPVVLQAMRIGDLAVCAIPFEVFAEIGLELKAKSPFAQTFTISHANGTHGYLPTEKQHALGGYETWLGTNRVELHAAQKITQNLLTMLNEMHAANKPAAK